MWYLLLLLCSARAFSPVKSNIGNLSVYKSSRSTATSVLNAVDNIHEITDVGVSTVINYDTHPADVIKDLLGQEVGSEWSYSELLEQIKNGKVEGLSIMDTGHTAIVIDNNHLPLPGEIHSGNLHMVKLLPETQAAFTNFLVEHHINFDVFTIPKAPFSGVLTMVGQGFINIGMFVIFSIMLNSFIAFLRSRGPGGFTPGMPPGAQNKNQPRPGIPGGMPLNQDKSQTNTLSFWGGGGNKKPIPITKFDDVAGCDEAKFELMEVVDFLKNSKKYEEAGAKIPKGVLLEGSPGTGKTLLAKAVSGEAGVPFISASGSEFIEMYVGLGASRVRQLFEQAKKMAPCVVFIDEIDAVGRQRGTGIAGGNDEREQTLNQLLTNMDGFLPSEGVVVLAATNRADILDSALLRPGRFDRKVKVPLPDKDGRKAISEVHFKNKKIGLDVDLEELAVLTSGFSGADIANLANEAAIFQVREGKSEISNDLLYKAYEKVTIGLPSNVQVKDEAIVELVANHEIGHALMAALFPSFFDVRKVTINENKSGMGGYTLFTPKERYLKYATKKYMLANLIVALGGRAAEVYLYRKLKIENEFEQKIFGDYPDLDITTGASNDLLQANKIAKNYITQYGFGSDFGQYDDSVSSQPFIGRDLGMSRGPSEFTKKELDEEIGKLVKFGYTKALELIESNEGGFNELVDYIKEKRTIDGKEVFSILEKHQQQK